jgi:subtilisin family serine protease
MMIGFRSARKKSRANAAVLSAGLVFGLCLAAACLLPLGPAPAGAAEPGGRSQPLVREGLYEEAAAQGSVRVIVTLDVPAMAELTEESNRYRVVEPGRPFPEKGRRAGRALADAIRSVGDPVVRNLSGSGTHVNHTYSTLPYLALEVSKEGLARLEALPQVVAVAEDVPYEIPEVSVSEKASLKNRVSDHDPSPPALDDSVDLVGADEAWDLGYTGEGWSVAVLDTGIRATHEFFQGKTIVEACFSLQDDCPNGGNEMTGPGAAAHYEDFYEGYDHGTHVAGIATGNRGTLFGVAEEGSVIPVIPVPHRQLRAQAPAGIPQLLRNRPPR